MVVYEEEMKFRGSQLRGQKAIVSGRLPPSLREYAFSPPPVLRVESLPESMSSDTNPLGGLWGIDSHMVVALALAGEEDCVEAMT